MGLDERGPEGSEAKGRETHIKLYEAQTPYLHSFQVALI
jgi:hypothetical protein